MILYVKTLEWINALGKKNKVVRNPIPYSQPGIGVNKIGYGAKSIQSYNKSLLEGEQYTELGKPNNKATYENTSILQYNNATPKETSKDWTELGSNNSDYYETSRSQYKSAEGSVPKDKHYTELGPRYNKTQYENNSILKYRTSEDNSKNKYYYDLGEVEKYNEGFYQNKSILQYNSSKTKPENKPYTALGDSYDTDSYRDESNSQYGRVNSQFKEEHDWTRMQYNSPSVIYITRYDTGEALTIPVTPEEIKCQAQTRFISYDVMKKGAVDIPLGDELTSFSWSSFLPGWDHRNLAFPDTWMNPKIIQGLLSEIRASGIKCKLTITGTPICHDVYLKNYDVTYKGGYGDYYYSITWVVARDLTVYVKTNSTIGNTSNSSTGQLTQSRTQKEKLATYTVKKGDSLWSIAKQQLGNGKYYKDILELNKDKYNKKTGFLPGQVIKLPIDLIA